MHTSERKYIIHILYILHVSATHVAIFRDVHYNGYVHADITRAFETIGRY